MDFQFFLLIPWVINFKIAKRDIPDHNVKAVITKFRAFKSFNLDVCRGVKIFRDPAADRIQLHSV